MADICGDNRFEIIESAKQRLIEATNIESRPEEMAVLDTILFRMWQMGWLPGCEHMKLTCDGCHDEFWGDNCQVCIRYHRLTDCYVPAVKYAKA